MKKINIIEVNDMDTTFVINFFPSDDENMVKKRIASKINSIPEYIIFLNEDILNYSESEPFYIQDMFNFIKNASVRNNSNIFSELYLNDEIVKELLGKFNIKDIFIIFLVYNNILDEQYKQTGFYSDIESTLKDFENNVLKDFDENIEFDYEELNKKWENREIIKRNFRDDIEKNKKFIIKTDALKIEINKVDKSLEYDEFIIKKEHILVKINNMPISVLELFNDIKLNDDISFVYCKEFYKILNGFKPENKNLIVSDNLTLELRLKKDVIQITINNGEMTFDHPKTLIGYEEIIEKIKSINLNLELSEPETVGLNGSFTFNDIKKQLKVNFNKYVFSDLIMNDKLFSKYMTLSELERAQKMRFHIYFHDEENKISFEISVSEEKNLRITVLRCKDIKNIKKFQDTLSKLLIIYSKRYDSIVKFYKTYIDLEEKEKQYIGDEETNMQLKYIAPEIFLSTSGCGSYNPTLLKSEEEYENALKEGKQVMIFPKNISKTKYKKMIKARENPLKFLVKDIYKFTCDYKEHKYPGVIVNKTKNKTDVPLLPCCYKTDQANKKSKMEFLKYFDIVTKDNKDNFNFNTKDTEEEIEEEIGEEIEEDEKITENVTKQQTKITTNKILKEGQYGDLPKEIIEFFF